MDRAHPEHARLLSNLFQPKRSELVAIALMLHTTCTHKTYTTYNIIYVFEAVRGASSRFTDRTQRAAGIDMFQGVIAIERDRAQTV